MEEILRRPAIFNGNVIPGYLVCSNGEIYSEKSNKFLKKDVDIHGYVRVKMTLDGRKDNRLISVHRLVTTAFIPNPDNKPDVNHIDGIKSHNYVSNLEWCTKSENIRHAMSHGLKPPTKGEDHGMSKYSNKQIEEVCKMLESGLYTLDEVSKISGVGINTVRNIVNSNQSWKHISQNYNVQNYKKTKRYYTRNQYEHVFKLLDEDILSPYDISDITGVSVNIIRKIYNETLNTNSEYLEYIDTLYDKYDISSYTPYNKEYSKANKINYAIFQECNSLIEKGISPKFVKRIISEKYDINEEFLRIHVIEKLI